MKFELIECFLNDGKKMQGIYIIHPEVFIDKRGFFLETYNEKDFFSAGIKNKFVQDNYSRSVQGVLRGLHFQKKNTQEKIIRLSYGKIYDVVVDLRNDSETFGRYFGVILDAEKQNMLYVSKGFAHGFLVLSDYADLIYKCSDFYSPEYEDGIKWNDPSLGIDWYNYLNYDTIILSEKDTNRSTFNRNKKYFDINGNWICN